MKKYILPIVAGLVLAAVVLSAVLIISDRSVSPEEVAARYLKACMLQDIDGMVKYASDYAKASLNGGSLPTDRALKEKLKRIYSEQASVYAGCNVTFGVVSSRDIDKDSAEYEEVFLKYSRLADFSKVSAVKMIELNIYVDGEMKQHGLSVAVKQGGKWRYAYQELQG